MGFGSPFVPSSLTFLNYIPRLDGKLLRLYLRLNQLKTISTRTHQKKGAIAPCEAFGILSTQLSMMITLEY